MAVLPVIESGKGFCCAGCLAVYTILEKQGVAKEESPLYEEAVRAGVISSVRAREEVEAHETETVHFEVHNMWCASCAEALTLILERQKGVIRCVVDYATDVAVLTFAPRQTSKATLFALIGRMGYKAVPLFSPPPSQKRLWVRFGLAVFCAANVMMLAFPLYVASLFGGTEGFDGALAWLSFGLAVPVVTFAAWPLWKRAVWQLAALRPGMESLVCLSVATAFLYSSLHLLRGDYSHLYFDSMSMVVVFVLLGKLLEGRAKGAAKEGILRLTRTLPHEGRRKSGERVPLKEIVEGDLLVATRGEKIVLDGCVVEGEGSVEEAVITGEARPVFKREGEPVVGGTVVTAGTLLYRVEKAYDRSLLPRLLAAVEHDVSRKREERTLLDRFLPLFVPFAILLALLAFLISGDPLRSLAVLLIACPCAIGLAAPLAEAKAFQQMAACGALVRNRKALKALADDPLFVFDKTGTLTEGKFRVLEEGLSDAEKGVVKGLVSHSIHPIALALQEAFSMEPLDVSGAEEHSGLGMMGSAGGKQVWLGSERFVPLAYPVSGEQSVLFFQWGEQCTHLILGDALRLCTLPHRSYLLSGDGEEAVQAVAAAFSIPRYRARCTPLEKRTVIEELQREGRPVVMVGDGVNDAPALAAADVGIAVTSASEMTIHVSDLFLTRADLDHLPKLVSLAANMERVIKQNLFWAFFYNAIGMGLALSGHLHPLFAAGAMVASSLCVLLNVLRKRGIKTQRRREKSFLRVFNFLQKNDVVPPGNL